MDLTFTNLRPLLPQVSETPNNAVTTSDTMVLQPKRRAFRPKVVIACRPCRTKKVKCDGRLPECGVCQSRVRSCTYEKEAFLQEKLVKKQKALDDKVESFTSLYRYLQDRPASEANRLFEQIRNGLSIDAAFEFVKAEGSNSTLAHSYPYRDPPNAWAQQTNDCNVLFEDDLMSIEASDAVIRALRQGIDCFFSYLSTMFPIYTKSEVDSIMTAFLASESESDELAKKKVAYSELLAICALGFQYDRQTLPNGSSTICTQFFKKAQLFVDYVLDKAPLRAMRICFCLGCYNVIAKSSLAINYTGEFYSG